MLGVIIGVGSVVLMTSVGASLEELILGQISSLGPQSMVIFPGSQEGPAGSATTGFDKLTFSDLRALEKLPTITSIAPIMLVTQKVTYGRETIEPPISGTVPLFFQNQNVTIDRGRLIDNSDIQSARSVVVLGPDAAVDLFGTQDPLGKKVTIGDRSFTVIGIFKPVGTQFFQNFDDRIFIPLPVAKAMTGRSYLSYITLQAVDDFDLAMADVKGLLRQRHGIVNPEDDPDKDDFMVRTSQQANEILGGVSVGLTFFITTVAGISLLVGGIGIMNIMLVAVTERTREIGLRKALGARRRDVLLQFLLEAIMLTLIAGLIGLGSGLGFAYLAALIVERFLDAYQFAVSVPSMFFAMGVAALTGIVFGMYPAKEAANLSPMEALRYE